MYRHHLIYLNCGQYVGMINTRKFQMFSIFFLSGFPNLNTAENLEPPTAAIYVTNILIILGTLTNINNKFHY